MNDILHVEKRSEKGFVLLSAVLILFLLAGFLGLLADTAHLQYARQQTQTAADAAAIAALYQLQQGNTAGMVTAAEADAIRNGWERNDGSSVNVSCPPRSGEFAADPAAVEVNVVQQAPTILMRMFGHGAVTVGARAVAFRGSRGAVTLGE